jgi:sugar phosphate isomerase/epimerase
MCWPTSRPDRRYAGVTHLDVTDFTPARADDVHALMAGHGVSISSLGYYPNALGADRAEALRAVEHIRKVIRAASLLGLGRMTTFIGRDHTLFATADGIVTFRTRTGGKAAPRRGPLGNSRVSRTAERGKDNGVFRN